MKRAGKVGLAVTLIFLFVPFLPLTIPRYLVHPWAGEPTCAGPTPGNVQAFVSPAVILLHYGTIIVPASNQPIQFQIFLRTPECA